MGKTFFQETFSVDTNAAIAFVFHWILDASLGLAEGRPHEVEDVQGGACSGLAMSSTVMSWGKSGVLLHWKSLNGVHY